MRQIASRSNLSVGNLYHHFGNKEAIFQRLIDHYWEVLLDPELPLNRIFAAARFPDDLETMAAAIDQVVSENSPYILLIYIDVIEFKGRHIRTFYQQMADRFRTAYAARFAEMREKGEIGEVDPLVASCSPPAGSSITSPSSAASACPCTSASIRSRRWGSSRRSCATAWCRGANRHQPRP